MPPSIVAPSIGEEDQPGGKVGPVVVGAEVTRNASSYVLAKRKKDDVRGYLAAKSPRPLCAFVP